MVFPVRWFLVWICTVLTAYGVTAKNTYIMDTQQDCGFIGVQDVQRDQTVTVDAKSSGSVKSSQGGCTINFRTVDADAHLKLEFTSFFINNCGVNLYISGDGTATTENYGCRQSSIPSTFFTVGRSITLTLHKTDINTLDYNFQLRLTAIRDNQYPPPGDTNPALTGLVIGVTGAVFGVIFIITCAGVCCFRKYRTGGTTKSPYLYDSNSKSKLEEERSHTSVGYTNESLRNGGTGHRSPTAKRKLLAPSDSSSDEKAESNSRNRPNTLNLRNTNTSRVNDRSNIPAPPPVPEFESYSTSPKSSNIIDEKSERGRDRNVFDFSENNTNKYSGRSGENGTNGRGAMLNALHSNSKFRNSFSENEADAEKRAKRISASSFEKVGPNSRSSDDNRKPPKLPAVPKSPKSPKSKHARIKRTPRPTSVSSEELAQIERGRNDSDDDPNIRVVRDESVSSSSEIVSIKFNTNDTDDKNKKGNTKHSLKPNRKGPQGRKKQTQSVSSALDPELKPVHQTQRDRVASTDGVLNDSFETQGSGRYNKRPSKSPKSRIKGFGHRRGRRDDQNDSRPTTPTSAFGSMEDLESLPPLGRAGSKSSLYSSRTSLYDRRGNRRRKGSYPESVASSYSRDDIGVMRHSRDYNDYYDDDEYFDGYEKPLSRRDKERRYRSDTNIGRTVSTQTLRETATQTGPDASVIFEPKLIVKKKRRPRSMSSSGTQTGTKKASGDGKTKAKTGEPSSPKTKTKRSKSVNITDDMKRSKSMEGLDTKPKVKASKPKPKPRKSTSADSILDDKDKSASKENLAENGQENPYYPKSEGFAVEGYPNQAYPGYPAYPNVPPPGYSAGPPGVQYPGQPGMQYPPPPNMQILAPGYPQNMYSQPTMTNVLPPTQQTREPRRPKKSNWEMLVDLTEGEYQDRNRDDVTETGSVASSVFTNPHSMPAYDMSTGNQAYYPPQPGYQPQQFGYQPPQQYVQNSKTEPQAQRVPNVSAGSREEALRKKSSWEALEEITDPQGHGSVQVTNNTKTETVI